jgi:hypothetical protein
MGADQVFSNKDPGEGIVLVPVPTQLLPAVYDLLAKSMNGSPAGPAKLGGPLGPDEVACIRCHGPALWIGDIGYQCESCGLAFRDESGGVRVDRDNGVWTSAMVASLRREVSARLLLVRALDSIARSAPAVVTSDDLMRTTGVDQSQVRAELAALSKASRRLFGKKVWPMSAKQGWGSGERMGYKMAPEIATWWLSAA